MRVPEYVLEKYIILKKLNRHTPEGFSHDSFANTLIIQ